MSSSILRKFSNFAQVEFDPSNAEHRQAYLTLALDGKQSSDLRFFLHKPHLSVVGQMQYLLALRACFGELSARGLSEADLLTADLQPDSPENVVFVPFPVFSKYGT